MANFEKKTGIKQQRDIKPEVKFNVKDTDFLLKMIMRSTFEGSEIMQAHIVLTKLSELHRSNLES